MAVRKGADMRFAYAVIVLSGSKHAHPANELVGLHATSAGAIKQAVELVGPAEDRWGTPETSAAPGCRAWHWHHYGVRVTKEEIQP